MERGGIEGHGKGNQRLQQKAWVGRAAWVRRDPPRVGCGLWVVGCGRSSEPSLGEADYRVRAPALLASLALCCPFVSLKVDSVCVYVF